MKLKLGLVALSATLGLSACGNQAGSPIQSSGDSNRIVGGEVVAKNDPIASMTGMLYDVKQKSICTVSILSSEWVLTAAHCVDGSEAQNLIIAFATSPLSKKPQDVAELKKNARHVVSFEVHPGYAEAMATLEEILQKAEAEGREVTMEEIDAVTDWGDIALLKIEGGLPEGFRPAKILDGSMTLQNGQVVTLAGYGITSGGPFGGGSGLLRKVDVAIYQAVWGQTEVIVDQTPEKGACHGDSGGPAYANVNGELHLFGVTSRGIADENDTCTVFAAYSNIQHHRDWIKQVSGL